MRTVLGITNQRQWEECIYSVLVSEQWTTVETIETKLMRSCLEWLGHMARMRDHAQTVKLRCFVFLGLVPATGNNQQTVNPINAKRCLLCPSSPSSIPTLLPVSPLGKLSKRLARTSSRGQSRRLARLTAVRTAVKTAANHHMHAIVDLYMNLCYRANLRKRQKGIYYK